MKSLLTNPLLILALLAPLNASADVEKGSDAYLAGNYATAVQEFKKATEQGNASAQFNLGVMYSNGRGVLQDDKEAVKWYRLAAEQGHVPAQYNLGLMYRNGEGVLQDNVYAHMWWNIVASEGNETAKKGRDIIAKQMTPSQIEEAQKLARECVAKEYKGC
jgi:TPR repeat protein